MNRQLITYKSLLPVQTNPTTCKWTNVAEKHKDVVEKFSKALKIKLFDSAFKQRQEVQNALSERKFILEMSKSDSVSDIKAICAEFIAEVNKL